MAKIWSTVKASPSTIPIVLLALAVGMLAAGYTTAGLIGTVFFTVTLLMAAARKRV